MNPSGNQRYIITGGPGFGKSTLIKYLRKWGYKGFDEVARELISQGIQAPLHLSRPRDTGFFREVLKRRIEYHQAASTNGPSFYDRGIPDSLAFFKLMDEPPPDHLMEVVDQYLYNSQVFIAPPWKDIFISDGNRPETFEEACRIHEALVEVYTRLDYDLTELPRVDPDTRVEFLLAQIGLIAR